ncbi:hypothetical protein BJX64DRAFT_301427 [Aspergillus heterothallicus]
MSATLSVFSDTSRLSNEREELSDRWVNQFLEARILQAVGHFLLRYHNASDPEEFKFRERGAYNITFQMKCKNDDRTIIRFPVPGATQFPEEKTRNETSIPVPFIYRWGTRRDSPLQLGSFIIMDYINHETSAYDALNMPDYRKEDRGVLDPDIDESKLELIYRQLANILLELSRPSLPKIGPLHQLGTLPRSTLPQTAFTSTYSYFEALADLHFAHLTNQRNDAIESADDCRRKFVARFLFRKLARDHRLTSGWSSLDKGLFKLWCDDLRPANFLLDRAWKVTGVVDWEFTYAAPVEFTYAPPWWLLLERPEYWSNGIHDWCTEYECRLPTFFQAMKEQERTAIEQGWLKSIYWHKIDERFFGQVDLPTEHVWKDRLALLSEEEKAEVEGLASIKVGEMQTRVPAWDLDEYSKELLGKGFERGRTRSHQPSSVTGFSSPTTGRRAKYGIGNGQ